MYKKLDIPEHYNNIVIVQFARGVGATEYAKAAREQFPNYQVIDNGITAPSEKLIDDCICVAIIEITQDLGKVKELSKANPGKPIIVMQAKQAYSQSYELKHEGRVSKTEAGFDYKGLNYQIDSNSRLNIVGKALELQLDSTIESVNWISNTKDSNGVDIVHTFTREEFIGFAKQIANYYESIILNS